MTTLSGDELTSLAQQLLLPAVPVDLTQFDPRDTHTFEGKKAAGKAALAELRAPLSDMQEQLFAHRDGGRRRVLVILQGMDTSGKGGVIRKTIGLVDPQGVRITSFKAPTDEELAHDFLWRITNAVPEPGYVGVFDRSHYEDVLIGRVRQLADEAEIERRYTAINDFEAELVANGTHVIKCMLHVSAEEQRERLLERLDRPDKHWKFNPGDIDERQKWPEYRRAYEIALERTNTEHAPWYLIPSDRKWFRNLAVGVLLQQTLAGLNLNWPVADFDVDEQRQRLETEEPLRD